MAAKITIELDDHTVANLKTLIQANGRGDGTHGELTLETLAAMLLEDVGLAVSRPGSWEGSKMASLLQSHGYEV